MTEINDKKEQVRKLLEEIGTLDELQHYIEDFQAKKNDKKEQRDNGFQSTQEMTFLDYALEDLQHNMGDIQPRNLASKDGVAIGLNWNQVIQSVNYITKKRILTWKSSGKEALQAMGEYLVNILDCSIKELQKNMGNIQPKDLINKEGTTINLTWLQVQQGVNFIAKTEIITPETSAKDALEAMGRFLA